MFVSVRKSKRAQRMGTFRGYYGVSLFLFLSGTVNVTYKQNANLEVTLRVHEKKEEEEERTVRQSCARSEASPSHPPKP